MQATLHRYGTGEALAEALSAGVAAVLAGGIATRGTATLAVSGGTTPGLFLERLSRTGIDWPNVTVTLVDERWVPETDERSNAAFVRRHLLDGPAAAAHFEVFHTGTDTPDEADLSARFSAIARPLDAVVLGMGGDGHTASYFPGADRLAKAIDPHCKDAVVALRAPGMAEARVSLSLPLIVDARFLALHIEGEAKMRVLQSAQEPGPVHDLPIRAVLRASRERALEIFWAP